MIIVKQSFKLFCNEKKKHNSKINVKKTFTGFLCKESGMTNGITWNEDACMIIVRKIFLTSRHL